jgi:aryl-alcohol dehydrogenase-like predicted oxidoreductase
MALGTMMFGAWANRDRADCIRIIHAALDAGINLVDTADVYSNGEAEEIVGEALAGRRDDVLVATKLHAPMGDDVNRRGGSRRWIIRACEESLRRLRTDWIDIYQLHRPDPGCDLDETLSALSDLVHQGKVRLIGSSTFQAEEIVEALWMSDARGHVRLRSEQAPYSLLTRGAETAVLPTCARHGMGVITYAPLGGGWLSGRYRRGEALQASPRTATFLAQFDPALPHNARKLDAIEQLAGIADARGISLMHLSLAFAASHPAVSSMILGPRTLEQLQGQLPALDVQLDGAVLDAIDAVIPPGTTVDPRDAGYAIGDSSGMWHLRAIGRAS